MAHCNRCPLGLHHGEERLWTIPKSMYSVCDSILLSPTQGGALSKRRLVQISSHELKSVRRNITSLVFLISIVNLVVKTDDWRLPTAFQISILPFLRDKYFIQSDSEPSEKATFHSDT